MADLVIRNGLLVDGTGATPAVADVEISGDRITAVSPPDPSVTDGAEGAGARHGRVIDATGLVVTPGFVDIHTHYDGQVTWDPILAPSSIHGVTSVAMGNCGVGFAPARPDRHEWLIGLLEGVEDIPGTALAEGMTWDWESFPEYLDSVAATPRTLDVGAHVPHAALRTYVMGDRGADHTAAPTDAELDLMAELFRDALRAGALGFATSRTEVHKTNRGELIGTLTADARELLTFARVMAEEGLGVTQLISDLYQTPDDEVAQAELDLLAEFVRTSGRPLSFTMQQAYHSPERWRHQMAWVDTMVAEGHDVKAQVASRPIGVLLGLGATANPFLFCTSYDEVASLPLPERVVALRDPARKAAILDQHAAIAAAAPEGLFKQILCQFDTMFRLSDPVDYELDADWSVAAEARAAGRSPIDVVYDALLDRDGEQLLYLPLFNFAHRSFDDLYEMITSPNVVFGLSDAGAHCGAICDGSFTTSAIALWARDRRRGSRLPLATVVHHQTQRTAQQVGWLDRGVVAPGYVADLNVIDLDALACHPPTVVRDLPAGGRRLMQTADGYRHTVKSGQVTFVDGVHTGALPGRLLRGVQPAGLGTVDRRGGSAG